MTLWAILNAPHPINNEQLLDAIRIVESGGENHAISPAGAYGPYQFMKATWEDRTDLPFSLASDPIISRQIALKQILWINDTLMAWNGSTSLEQILAAYNGGIGRLRNCDYDVNKMPEEPRAYVKKVLGVINENEQG